jgi:hypothetical protein
LNRRRSLVPASAMFRRVRRHAALAVLFRAPRPASAPLAAEHLPSNLSSAAIAPAPDVQAATVLRARSSLPAGFLVGSPAPTGPSSIPCQLPLEQPPVLLPQAASVPAESRPQWDSGTMLQREAGDDTEWHRLQRIFRLHQGERAMEGAAASTTSSVGAQTERAPLPQGQPVAVRQHDRDQNAGPGATVVAGTAPVQRTTSSPRSVLRPQPEAAQGDPDLPAPLDDTRPPGTEAPPEAGEPPAAQASGGVPVQRVSGDRSVVQRELELPPAGEPGAELEPPSPDMSTADRPVEAATAQKAVGQSSPGGKERQAGVGKHPLEARAIPPSDVSPVEANLGANSIPERGAFLASQDEVGAQIEASPDTQSLPLQAAWPVQRLAGSMHGEEAPGLPPASTLWMAERERGDTGESTPVPSATLQRSLAGTTPGSRSQSAIEFLAPRRSRPRPGACRAEAAARAARPDEVITPGGPAAPAVPEHHTAQPKQTPVEDQLDWEPGAESDLIPTNIGPLPADLWRLVGQEPPRQGSPEGSQAGAGSADAASTEVTSQTGSSAPSRSVAHGQVQPSASETPTPSIVQRAVMPAVTAEPGGPSPGAAPVQAPPEEPAAVEADLREELDTDELARQVYGEIRRRLAVEVERLRWRL